MKQWNIFIRRFHGYTKRKSNFLNRGETYSVYLNIYHTPEHIYLFEVASESSL